MAEPALPPPSVKKLVKAEVHKDKNGVPQMPQTVTSDKEDVIVVHPQPEFGSSNGTVEKIAGDERPFRHSNEYRKSILKGLQPSKPNVLITKHGINGKSKANFKLEAASTN